MKAKTKLKGKKGFLGNNLYTQEQVCMHIIKPTCVGKIMCMQVLAQKTLKAQPRLKH